MRTWVIPDVHGCLLTLHTLVEDLIGIQEDDSLIFLGDVIDRGPASKGVIDYIMKLGKSGINTTVIRGNHEEYMAKVFREEQSKSGFRKMLGLRSGDYKDWMLYGGESTLQSFNAFTVSAIPEMYIQWIESLEYYVKWKKFLIVHAGFNFEVDDIFSDTQAMMWIREYKINPEKLGDRKIIHGHVPVTLDFIHQSVISNSFQFIDLDNGVYLTDKPGFGNLLALELNTMELLVQPNLDF
ncbi:MAG: metallophosphoesterase [Bacteroidales bacterium]|nr:metallophosphoesterase [Bacteroidales bacterium]